MHIYTYIYICIGGAVCFGASAIDHFLENNDLSYIIRAHEAHAHGVSLSKGARYLIVWFPSQVLTVFLYIHISLVHVVMSWRKSLSWLGCICTVCMYNESADKEANKIISLFKFSYACINTAWYYHDAIKHNSSKKLTYSILLWSTTEILIWLFMC
jgi:hypothetical protein